MMEDRRVKNEFEEFLFIYLTLALCQAPISVVFDLSRSIDLHKISTQQTKEEDIPGVTSGLIKKGEWVTW